MFDCFIGELQCPQCKTINSADSYTNMQTHIRGCGADGSELAIGFLLNARNLTSDHLVATGYALISPPDDVMSPRLLGTWICPVCTTEQWAAVEIVQQRIERIFAVVLNRASFELSNYINEASAEWFAAAALGLTWAEVSERKLTCIDMLRQVFE